MVGSVLIENLSIIESLIEESEGFKLNTSQKEAIKSMYSGNITDIETGEGKTVIITALAILKGMEGRRVIVVTPNQYLNKVGFDFCSKLTKGLNLVCGLNQESEIIDGKKELLYNSDIIYSTSSELVFDYLRNKDDEGFIEDMLCRFVIIDEIDQILVDNSNTNFSISVEGVGVDDRDLMLYKLTSELCKFFIGGEITSRTYGAEIEDQGGLDFIYNKEEGVLFLTERGDLKLNTLLGVEVGHKEYLPLLSAVHNTLRARNLLKKGENYVVTENKISIIDLNNGRVKLGNRYSSGINLALEIKEGCEITATSDEERSINGLFFFSQFQELVGCSGTSHNCKDIFLKILGVEVKKIKRNKRINIEYKPYRVFRTKEEKYKNIIDLIKDLQIQGLPVLAVAENDNICKEFVERAKSKFSKLKILTNDNIEDEVNIIRDSSKPGSVLVSTLITGRGTDIVINEEIADKGGLQVVFLSRFPNYRAERQIVGRTGRQGSKGVVHVFTSIEDNIFNHLTMREKQKLIRDFERGNINRVNRKIKQLQQSYSTRLDSIIVKMYLENFILNLFENYLETITPYPTDYLYEIENFIKGRPIDTDQGLNQCIIDTKKFIDEMIEEWG